jgi:ribosomal protein L29
VKERVMKTKEIREKNDEALEHELRDRQKLLKVRRDIARMKTILRQRQIEQERKGDNGSTAKKTEKQTEPRTAKRTMKKTVKKKTTRKREKKAPVAE